MCRTPTGAKAANSTNPVLDRLAEKIYTAEESAKVPGQSYKCNSDRLDGQAITGQNSFVPALCSQMDEKDYPDQ